MITPSMSPSQARAVMRQILNVPRWVVVAGIVAISVCFVLIGVITYSYPPDYLAFPKVWAAVFVAGGALGIGAAFHPTMALVAAAGAALIGGTFVRGVAIGLEVGWTGMVRAVEGLAVPIDASFSIAVFQWFGFGVALLLLWPIAMFRLRADRRSDER